jgi:hypothetical protein
MGGVQAERFFDKLRLKHIQRAKATVGAVQWDKLHNIISSMKVESVEQADQLLRSHNVSPPRDDKFHVFHNRDDVVLDATNFAMNPRIYWKSFDNFLANGSVHAGTPVFWSTYGSEEAEVDGYYADYYIVRIGEQDYMVGSKIIGGPYLR